MYEALKEVLEILLKREFTDKEIKTLHDNIMDLSLLIRDPLGELHDFDARIKEMTGEEKLDQEFGQK